MILSFDKFELDTNNAELRIGNREISLEPKPYNMLCLLVENSDRVISKEELVERIWDGRFITDAAISTTVKAVRKALDDDGIAQKFIRTKRGHGFKFVASVRIRRAATVELIRRERDLGKNAKSNATPGSTRPVIAVLPFKLIGRSENHSAISDAIPVDIIASLSRLRWLQVIARGSTFRFRNATEDLHSLYSVLGATYCLSGIVEVRGKLLSISVELSDTRSNQVVWGDNYTGDIDDIHHIRSEIDSAIAGALGLQIQFNEATRARLRPSESLDAWGSYHLGIQHSYRFNRRDNEIAARHFETATQLDPQFSAAFAARSFTSFQKVILNIEMDSTSDIDDALRHAEKSLALDPMNPSANYSMGRMHVHKGNYQDGINWLERSTQLNPNYSHGYYARALADILAGRSQETREHVAKAIELSPLDPMLCAMQGVNALAHLYERDFARADKWATTGAHAPNAYHIIAFLAAATSQLNGKPEEARAWVKTVLERRPNVSTDHFFKALPFRDADFRRLLSEALNASGLPLTSQV